jgi:hypothetical protein
VKIDLQVSDFFKSQGYTSDSELKESRQGEMDGIEGSISKEGHDRKEGNGREEGKAQRKEVHRSRWDRMFLIIPLPCQVKFLDLLLLKSDILKLSYYSSM